MSANYFKKVSSKFNEACRRRSIFHKNDLFDLCDPYMTFEVKLLITLVATHLLVILTKFGRNRIKHVEEEANCEKERKKEERRRKKSQERNKLGGIPPNLTKQNKTKQKTKNGLIEPPFGEYMFIWFIQHPCKRKIHKQIHKQIPFAIQIKIRCAKYKLRNVVILLNAITFPSDLWWPLRSWQASDLCQRKIHLGIPFRVKGRPKGAKNCNRAKKYPKMVWPSRPLKSIFFFD